MNPAEMQARTRRFALDIIALTERLPRTRAAEVIGRQLLRSATSVGANYRAACRARSDSDFIAKLKIVEEEADESAYWLSLLIEANLGPQPSLEMLFDEANQLIAMIVASIKTARTNRHARPQHQERHR
jgi:four helix bundle protein